MKLFIILIIVFSVTLILMSLVLFLSMWFQQTKEREIVIGEHVGGLFARITEMVGGIHHGISNGANRIVLTGKDKPNQYTSSDESLISTYFEESEFMLNGSGKYVTRTPWIKFLDKLNPVKIGSEYYNVKRKFSSKLWGKHRIYFPAKSKVPLINISNIVTQYIRFKQSIVTKAEEWYTNNIDPLKYLICVHYRGTDTAGHYPYKKTDPDLYFKCIDSILKKHPDSYMFVATDQESFASTISEKYKNCKLYESPRSNSSLGLHNEVGIDKNLLGESVIVDALLLSKADYLIKARSNVSDFSLFNNIAMECSIIYSEEEMFHKPSGKEEKFVQVK